MSILKFLSLYFTRRYIIYIPSVLFYGWNRARKCMSLYVQIQNQLPIKLRHNGHRIKRWSYNTLIKSQKTLTLALSFRGVSEWAKEPLWRAVTSRQNTNRNQRLGVKTPLPECIRNSRICFEKIMRCPLLSSSVFHYGNVSVSWGNERNCPVQWLSPRA